MKDENLKDLSIDDLLQLLGIAQRDYTLARINKVHPDLLQEIRDRLKAVQQAIVENVRTHSGT